MALFAAGKSLQIMHACESTFSGSSMCVLEVNKQSGDQLASSEHVGMQAILRFATASVEVHCFAMPCKLAFVHV